MALRPPRLRPIDDDSSMPVDLTSIDANEYRAGFNCGLQGDDDEDLKTVDLFGVVDGDDSIEMATPSSTATPMPPQGLRQRTRTTSTTQAQPQARNRKNRT
jgi:hypothetical protein